MFDIAMVYQEVADLAKIFDVQDKGEALIASLVARMDGQLDERLEGIDHLRAAFGSHILEE